jgi:hypothetical protein
MTIFLPLEDNSRKSSHPGINGRHAIPNSLALPAISLFCAF